MRALWEPACGAAREQRGSSLVVFATATTSPFRGRCAIPLGLTHFCQLLHILQAEEAGASDRRGRRGKLTFVC
jgi:hypothetical protein